MNKNSFIISILLIVTLFSCEKQDSFEILSKEKVLIVDGIITNGPDDNYIKLSLSDTKFYDSLMYFNSALPVNNAFVIVSDDMGNIDTLSRRYFYSYNEQHKLDSTANTTGIYDIRKIKGKPGHSYFLYIKHLNKEYRASTFMNEVPLLDTLKFDKTWDPVKSQDYYPPLVSFKKLQSPENYYFFVISIGYMNSYCMESSYEMLDQLGGRSFNMTILDDAHLSSYVSGLDVGKCKAPDYWITSYTWANPGDSVKVRMFSATKEGYQYFDALFKQIDNDGGIFNPAPTTPKGNISNGAMGYFGASAVSKIKGTVKTNN